MADGWTVTVTPPAGLALLPIRQAPAKPTPDRHAPDTQTQAPPALSQDAQDALAVDLWAARRWNWEALGIPGWVETPPPAPSPAQSEALAIGKAAREAGLAPVPGGSRKGGMILLAPMPKGE
jgi:hypothetical protein